MTKSKTKKETFGAWLSRHRKAIGYTQAELAAKIDRQGQLISLYERDHSEAKSGRPMQLPLDLIVPLAKALRVPADEVRQAAGYAPIETAPDEFEQFRSYLAEMPDDARADALAIVKTLHARRKTLTPDLEDDFRVLPEAKTSTSN